MISWGFQMKNLPKQKKKYIAPNIKEHGIRHQVNLLTESNAYHGTFGMHHAEETLKMS